MRLDFRRKVVLALSAVMALTGTISALAGLRLIAGVFLGEMYNTVRLNLNTARAIYAQSLRDVETTVRFAAGQPAVREAELERIRLAEGLDILARLAPDARLDTPLMRSMRASPRIISGTALFTARDLSLFDPGLKTRAAIPLAGAGPARALSAGMVQVAAVPVKDARGRLLCVFLGGRLLSGDADIVDRIMSTLYQGLRYRGRDAGVVSLFQGDIRVATTIRTADGSRAMGTRATDPVIERALTKDEPGIGRVYALGNWVIASHESIRDFQGRPIGSLFLGELESRYTGVRARVLLAFLLIVGCGMGAAHLVGLWLSGRITEPLRALTQTARRLAAGDLSARSRLTARDEFGDLSAAFDNMAQNLQHHERRVKRDVERQMAESERLAMVGQLAAGVAHEINNPLGGILVYSHLLLDDTPADDPRRANLEKIAQESSRCRDIVRSLLDFARQGQLNVEDVDLHALLEATVSLAATHQIFRDIRVVRRFSAKLPPIALDRGKIQQVVLNILFNAAEAMEGRPGDITLTARLLEQGLRVAVWIRDSGAGMAPEVLEKVFEPFFTTKEVGKGVGLGLSVSYGIVEKHGGRLDIRSRAGHGTVVRIILPVRGAS